MTWDVLKEPREITEADEGNQVRRYRSVRMIRSNPIKTDQIKPNPTKNNGPAGIKAQAVGSKLGRTSLDLGRAHWMPGGCERMNGKAKELSDRNTFFICDTDERGVGLEENLRLFSLILAYLRLMGKKCLRHRAGFPARRPWAFDGLAGGAAARIGD